MSKKTNGNVVQLQPRVVVDSKVVDAAWRSLLEQNVPPETHPELVKAFKRFFYAGAKSLCDTFLYTDCLDENSPDLTKTDMMRFEGICNEVHDFFLDVASGRQ